MHMHACVCMGGHTVRCIMCGLLPRKPIDQKVTIILNGPTLLYKKKYSSSVGDIVCGPSHHGQSKAACIAMCIDMRINMRADMCVDMCVYMCGGLCIDTCVDMCIDRCI